MSVPAKHKSSNPYAKKKQAHIDDVRAGGAGEGGGSAGAGAAGGAKKGSFKIVHIPCEVADAMTEWVVDMPEGQEINCLIDTIKPHFSKFTAADAAKQRDAFAANLRTHLKPGQELTDSALTQIMSMGSLVDTVPLIYNTKDVGFVSVTMYVDDQGASKELPMNRRATAITQQCHQPVQVLGDAFIGRFFDDEDGYARHDFTLAEASDGGCPWFALAQRQAAARAARNAAGGNGMSDRERIEQAIGKQAKAPVTIKPKRAKAPKAAAAAAAASSSSPLPAAVEAHKKEGNAHFGAKRFADAVTCYSAAIGACGAAEPPGLHVLFSNRSAARLALGESAPALADGKRCVALCPAFAKGHFRVGRAALAAGAAQEAKEAAAAGLKLDKRNADLQQLRDEAQQALASGGGGGSGGKAAKAEAEEVAKAEAEEVAPCEYALAPIEGSEDTLATFVVPASLVELLATDCSPKTVLARGCQFELKVGATAGTVTSRFYSPMPDMTAQAIAIKIARRAAEPIGNGAEFCSIM